MLSFEKMGKVARKIAVNPGRFTKDQLLDLGSYFNIKSTLVLAEIASRFFKDEEMQEDFINFSKGINDDRFGTRDLGATGVIYQLPKDVVDTIDANIYRLRFNDRSNFLRVLIAYFWDRYCTDKSKDIVDRGNLALINAGFQVIRSGRIDKGIFYYVEHPDVKS